jgi:eukaryotic-like serine/threonine-protein kinase
MPLWNEIEGRRLADGSVLGALLRSEGRTAWFAVTDAEGQPAVMSVFEALNDEESVAARLQSAARLEHPNLVKLGSVGTTRLDDETLVHVPMELYDQTLADVLRDRPLAPDEAKEVAENLLSALEAVERAGLRHGHVDASGVLAVGDAIKLRSDCLAPAHGESDAAALAALLYQALTTRRFAGERDALQLPAPFASMVRAGAGGGGSLAAMRRVLTGPVVSSASAPSVGAANAPASQPAQAADTAKHPAAASTSARGPGALGGRAASGRPDPAVQPRRPGVLIAAASLMVILLVVFWLAFRRPPGHTPISGQATIAAAPPVATPPDQPAPAPNPAEQNAGAMGSSAPAPPSPRAHALPTTAPLAAAVPASPSGQERSVWHVIVYTYAYQSAAQAKAEQLAAKYPQFEPQIFSATGHAPYLVTLGGGMDRESAYARRDAARKAGMPQDTYAQNFRK